jgi:type IV pilus assembly protein PilP
VRSKIIHISIIFLAIVFVCAGGQTATVFADEKQAPAEEKELKFTEKMAAILFQEKEDSFVYVREGRSDPFVSFVREQVKASEAPIEELTGMRKFEPGQLYVRAIVIGSKDRVAMVEDSKRQGYILREGTLLGRTGVVEAIEPNTVKVRNYTYNLAGDKIYKTVEMVLNPEGEK